MTSVEVFSVLSLELTFFVHEEAIHTQRLGSQPCGIVQALLER